MSMDGAVRVENVIPILSVRDLKASIEYYQRVLGFRVDWGGNEGDGMASVSRDDHPIMLCQGSQGQSGTWVWIGVTDARMLHEELKAAGARIAQEPTNYSWALEIRVEDPDGHVLRFGSHHDHDLPFLDQA